MSKADELADLRRRIDAVDEELVRLLNERAGISLAVGRIKEGSPEPVFKPFREQEVLDTLARKNPGPLPERHLRAIYREIMSSSRRLQRPERVVYLGPEGTHSYFAALRHMGRSARLVPKTHFRDIFRAVADGEAALGVLPLENSLQGTVGRTVDLFMEFPVFIQAETYHRISHALLTHGGDLSAVTEVHSHPQALEQCDGWLTANLPQAERFTAASTAAAAQLAAGAGSNVAAVGALQLAEPLGLTVAAEHIEDMPDNWTRFLVIGALPSDEDGRDKTSMLFTTPDKPGALAHVLETLAREGINMTKLESRPLKGETWKYVFFADLECDLSRAEYEAVLADLKSQCHTLRILGSYPPGDRAPGAP